MRWYFIERGMTVQSFRKFLPRVFCGGSKFQNLSKFINTLIIQNRCVCLRQYLFLLRKVMPYQKISSDRKQRALFLLLEEDWDKSAVADAMGVSEKSIDCWEELYRTEGCVTRPSFTRGRPRLLTTQMADELHELISESPSLILEEIAEWLALYHDRPISITALHDNLQDLGFSYKKLKRVAAERNDELRSDWLHNITANYTAEQLVFLDESSKDDRVVLRRYGRAPSGRDPVNRTSLSKGVRYSVLPALSLQGYLAVRVVEGSIDSAEFFDFVLNDVVSVLSCILRLSLLDQCPASYHS